MGLNEIKGLNMARATFFNKLPEDIQQEVNKRLRQSSYGNQKELLEWLIGAGYNVTKSSLSRYSTALRRSDGYDNMTAHEIAAETSSSEGLSRQDAILIELGKLKLRENELITELMGLRE
jgi:hypothetical protein